MPIVGTVIDADETDTFETDLYVPSSQALDKIEAQEEVEDVSEPESKVDVASTFQTRYSSAPYQIMQGNMDETETETLDTTFETQCELMNFRSEPDHYGALLAKIACQ